MINLIAIVTCKSGQREAVLDHFNEEFRPKVLAESGCIVFDAVIDTVDADPGFGPDVFVVIEKWESQAAVDVHCFTPHRADFFAAVAELLVPTQTKVYYLDPTA